VLIADDDTLMRCGLRVLLEREEDVDVLGGARAVDHVGGVIVAPERSRSTPQGVVEGAAGELCHRRARSYSSATRPNASRRSSMIACGIARVCQRSCGRARAVSKRRLRYGREGVKIYFDE
jgi:hypothetical protein